jgi:hypothetical protein
MRKSKRKRKRKIGRFMGSSLVLPDLLTGHEPGLLTTSAIIGKFDKVSDKVGDKVNA